MDLYNLTLDPNTATSRNYNDEWEEDVDIETYEKNLIPPLLTFAEQATEASLSSDAAILAVSKESVLFARTFLNHCKIKHGSQAIQLVGSYLLPDTVLSGSVNPEENIQNGLIYLLTLPDNRRISVVLAGQDIPDTRSYTWTQTLLKVLPAQQVLVLDTLPSGAMLHAQVEPPYLCRVRSSKAGANQAHAKAARKAARKALKESKGEEKSSSSPSTRVKGVSVPLLQPPNMVISLSLSVSLCPSLCLFSHTYTNSLPDRIYNMDKP